MTESSESCKTDISEAANACNCRPHNEAENLHKKGESYKKLVMLAGFASVSTAILLIVMKFVVWLFSGSASILASLTDSMLDLGASFINLLALRYALIPPDDDHRFGHYKAEALAALTQAAFISGSAVLLIINGYDRIVKPHPLDYVDIGIYVSVASIVLTLLLTVFQGYVLKITGSEAVAADRFHYLSDVGLNLSVIVALLLTDFGYASADGVIAMLLGLYILHSSWHIGKTAVGTLLDRSVSEEENEKIKQVILGVDGVTSFHDLRTRCAGPQCYIQCHIVLPADMSLNKAHDITDEIEHKLSDLLGEVDVNLHMEPDVDETFRDVRFMDHVSCELPEHHYVKCDLPEDFSKNALEKQQKAAAEEKKSNSEESAV